MSGTGEEVPLCECGVAEGELHAFGCRFEICPFCNVDFAEGCDCAYVQLGLKSNLNPPQFAHLPKQVYRNGLTAEQRQQWQQRCEARGRLPFVYTPQTCARCGTFWPDLFVVQDAAWLYYAGPRLAPEILCEGCFHTIRRRIDEHQQRPAWVPAESEIVEYVTAWRYGDRATLMRLDPGKFSA